MSTPAHLADIAELYELVGKINEVARRLKYADVDVRCWGSSNPTDPLSQTMALSVTMKMPDIEPDYERRR